MIKIEHLMKSLKADNLMDNYDGVNIKICWGIQHIQNFIIHYLWSIIYQDGSCERDA